MIIRVILFIIAYVLGVLGLIFNARKEYFDFVSSIGAFDTFVWNESWLFWGIVVILVFIAEMIIWSPSYDDENRVISSSSTGLDGYTNSNYETTKEFCNKKTGEIVYQKADNDNKIGNTSIGKAFENEYQTNIEDQTEKDRKLRIILEKEARYIAEMKAKEIFNPIIKKISLSYILAWILPVILLFFAFCLLDHYIAGSVIPSIIGIIMFLWLILGGLAGY